MTKSREQVIYRINEIIYHNIAGDNNIYNLVQTGVLTEQELIPFYLKAVRKGSHFAVKSFLIYGMSANQRDENNDTPLIWAARLNNHQMIADLMAFGADPDFTNCLGKNALVYFEDNLYTGYDLVLKTKENKEFEEGVLYITVSTKDSFQYVVKSPNGTIKKGVIAIEDIKGFHPQGPLNVEKLRTVLKNILFITSKRGHTAPLPINSLRNTKITKKDIADTLFELSLQAIENQHDEMARDIRKLAAKHDQQDAGRIETWNKNNTIQNKLSGNSLFISSSHQSTGKKVAETMSSLPGSGRILPA
ncbi:ankyrin repeat domain-containing protein [Legionella spiritensis]|uniref:ankyrin repeat domain-containing protein n=1 Tax=Legionella spiritensis TaxID=452 RepID=UPI000F6C4739|nr:ankyrin repeat domain-containing protein [Legionella spiritensis]VEG89980.1 Ankyrin repeat [Legionella spiritensis]